MRLVTSKEMQSIDRAATAGIGIPALALMERAGAAVARKVIESYRAPRALVLCGGGNNGGDGMVVARELLNAGMQVKVRLLGKKDHLSHEAAVQLSVIKKLGIPVSTSPALAHADLHGAVIVDAIFGTGLKKEITGPIAKLIEQVNESHSPVVSVDIPSGISADTGQVMGIAFNSDATVTFGLPKRGHYLHPGAGHTGRLYVEDIGFPAHLLNDRALRCHLLDHKTMASAVPPRPAYSHKGDYGYVLVIGCSAGKTGAGLMTARASAITGAGFTTLAAPASIAPSLYGMVTEEMVLPLPDDGKGGITPDALDAVLGFVTAHRATLAIGPGIGSAPHTAEFIRGLVRASAATMVIDAEAINALQGMGLSKLRAPVILTPHPVEFARLSGIEVSATEADRIEAALGYAKSSRSTLVLKGTPTVIATPEGEASVNPLGNPGMAKGGAGDVLTGIIAALAAQGLGPAAASSLGVYIHSLSADIAASKKDVHSVLASDIINHVPDAFRALSEVN